MRCHQIESHQSLPPDPSEASSCPSGCVYRSVWFLLNFARSFRSKERITSIAEIHKPCVCTINVYFALMWLIYSSFLEEHVQQLLVSEHLKIITVVINPSKCDFGKPDAFSRTVQLVHFLFLLLLQR